jgi:two-component system, NtrC family, sensor kinase
MVHVLVVDDERDFADLLAERLRARGMEVHTAYSGQEALEAVRAVAPEVVVLDITMPGMSGLETLDAVKAEKPSPEVILLTADSTLHTAVAGMKGGARDYLTKPTDIDVLVAAIGEAEGRHMEALSRQRMAQTAKLAALGELATGVAHEINNPLQVVINEIGWIEELVVEAEVERTAGRDHEFPRTAPQPGRTVQEHHLQAADPALYPGQTRRHHEPAGPGANAAPWTQGAHCGSGRTGRRKLGPELAALEFPPQSGSRCWPTSSTMPSMPWKPPETAGATITGYGSVLRGNIVETSLEVSVRDSGCGIEEHLLTRIFEPFFSTKEVGKGIGLGLAICHGIIEAMGGSISVRSTPGHGSTFTIKAPMAVHAHNEHNGPDDPASAKEE